MTCACTVTTATGCHCENEPPQTAPCFFGFRDEHIVTRRRNSYQDFIHFSGQVFSLNKFQETHPENIHLFHLKPWTIHCFPKAPFISLAFSYSPKQSTKHLGIYEPSIPQPSNWGNLSLPFPKKTFPKQPNNRGNCQPLKSFKTRKSLEKYVA